MAKFAHVAGGRVFALLDGAAAQWPDLAAVLHQAGADVEIGWVWDGAKFSSPAPEPALRTISPLAFRRRFTDAERAAITLAASKALAAGDATLQVWLDDLNSATEVDMDLPEVAAAMALLVAAKLITAARRVELLA